jgi:hypothetical protein
LAQFGKLLTHEGHEGTPRKGPQPKAFAKLCVLCGLWFYPAIAKLSIYTIFATQFLLHVDKQPRGAYFGSTWGFSMKYLRWTIVIVGVWFVSMSSVVPRFDAPETVYNEADTPVNLTTLFVARKLIMPAGHSAMIPREQRAWREPDTTTHAVSVRPARRVSHSVLDLLCTLLC